MLHESKVKQINTQIDRKEDMDRQKDVDWQKDVDRQKRELMIWTLTCETSGAKGQVGDVDFCKEKNNQSINHNQSIIHSQSINKSINLTLKVMTLPENFNHYTYFNNN